jgi:hypothetical protein
MVQGMPHLQPSLLSNKSHQRLEYRRAKWRLFLRLAPNTLHADVGKALAHVSRPRACPGLACRGPCRLDGVLSDL